IPLLEQAMRVSPRDPSIGNWYVRIGVAHLVQSRIDEAVVWFRKARSANPGNLRPHVLLASAYALSGKTEHAAAELAEARRLGGDVGLSSFPRWKSNFLWGGPKFGAFSEPPLSVGLGRAGWRER